MKNTINTLRGLYEVTRPLNTFAAGLLTLVGVYVASGQVFTQTGILAMAVTWIATSAGNTINDYFDREVDAINNPERAIPRGAVSPTLAVIWTTLLFGCVVLLSAFLSRQAWILIGINIVLLIAYTPLLKGSPGGGNITVAFLSGSTFLLGGVVAGNITPTLFLFALAALATLSREIIKDIEDIEGDKESGLNTIPIRFGERNAFFIATGSILICLLAVMGPYLQGVFGTPYLVAVLPGAGIIAGSLLKSFTDPSTGHKLMKIGMFFASLSFIAGRFFATTPVA